MCRLKEGGRSKCHQYWPDKANMNEFNAIKSSKITELETNKISENLFERIFEVEGDGKKLRVR